MGLEPATFRLQASTLTSSPLVPPDIAHKKQEKQKEGFDRHTRDRKFSQGDYVYARNFRDNSTKWLLGKIVKQIGNVAII